MTVVQQQPQTWGRYRVQLNFKKQKTFHLKLISQSLIKLKCCPGIKTDMTTRWLKTWGKTLDSNARSICVGKPKFQSSSINRYILIIQRDFSDRNQLDTPEIFISEENRFSHQQAPFWISFYKNPSLRLANFHIRDAFRTASKHRWVLLWSLSSYHRS